MAEYRIAHIREQGQDMIIVPLESRFHNQPADKKESTRAALQQCAAQNKLGGTVCLVWEYGMTLRMDEEQIRRAKAEASRRGKSVSQMVGEFVDGLGSRIREEQSLPPVTASLVGVLKDRRLSESDYKKHLRERHL